MDMMLWIWLAVIVLTAAVEVATVGLVSIWLCVGAVAALIAAVAGASLTVQLVIFVVVSAAALVITRPLVKKFSRKKAVSTNLDRVIGKTAKVTETIDNKSSEGAAYADGKTWTARSVSGERIQAGETVEVVKIEGVKLFVDTIHKTNCEEAKQ